MVKKDYTSYLKGLSAESFNIVKSRIENGTMRSWFEERYSLTHSIQNDRELYNYVKTFKDRWLKSTAPLHSISWDPRSEQLYGALGLFVSSSKNHGRKTKSRREIRVSTFFKSAPLEFLKMVVVHELAHLRHDLHDKQFYALCCHMEPQYYELELHTRIYFALCEWERSVRA